MRVEVEEELEELDQHSNSADRHTPGLYVFDDERWNVAWEDTCISTATGEAFSSLIVACTHRAMEEATADNANRVRRAYQSRPDGNDV
jgi:hypothetical protein